MKKWLAILMAVAFAGTAFAQNVIDSWDFNVPDGAINTQGSYSDLGSGGVTWPDKSVAAISNSSAVFFGQGTNSLNNYFGSANGLSANQNETSGKYQLSVDIVSADFANTAAKDQKATWGLGVRGTSGDGSTDNGFRLIYEGGLNITNTTSAGVTNIFADADHFFLTCDAKGVGFSSSVNAIIAGNSISNLNVRQVYDIDAGTYEVYYTLAPASETLLYSGDLTDGFKLGELRIASQQFNGGAIWELGDVLAVDNIELRQLVAPATKVYEGNLSIVDSKTGTHNTTPTNYTYKTFANAEVGDVVVVLQATNKGYDPDATDSTGVITFGGTAALDEGPLNRVAIGGAPSTVWYATVTAAGSVDVNLSHTNSWQAIGTYLVRSDSDEIELVAMDANSATDPAAVTNLYDFGGMVDGEGLFFEATSGNDAAGPVSSNAGTILDVGSSSRQIAHGTYSGVSALTNIWTMTTAGKRTGVAGIVLAGLGTSPRVAVDEWDMNSNGEFQLSNNGLALPNSGTNGHQFAQTPDDGLFTWAVTNASAYSGKTTLSTPVVLSNTVAKMTLKLTALDWSTNEAANTSFGIRLYDGGANYVGLKITDQGGVSKTRVSCEDSDGDNGNYGRLSQTMVVTNTHTITIELDYANSEIRLSGNWEWSPDGTSGVQTNSFDFAGKGITELTRIQTRSANWSAGDYIVLDNLDVVYTTLPAPPPADTPEGLYNEWLAGNGYTSNTNLLEDSNGNGINNLTEYAVGGAANMPVSTVDGAYLLYVNVQWDAAEAAARGLDYEVLAADNLVVGAGFTTNDVEFVGSVDGAPEAGYSTVTNRVPTDLGARFMKLDITFTP